jgi:PncC family amidohydrolase
MQSVEQRVVTRLRTTRNTLSVAESCTGGMIGTTVTRVAGASTVFKGGVIAYDNAVKQRLLGVGQTVLCREGAVSAGVVSAMARGVKRLLRTTCSVAVSGIAGPGGGTPEKPRGLVYVGVAVPGHTRAFRHRFTGGRDQVRRQAVEAALRHLLAMLSPRRRP